MDRSDMMHIMYDKKGPAVAKNFEKRGFAALYCPTKEEALAKAVSLIPETDVVSWGGSTSIVEMGLYDYVKAHNPVLDRDTAKTPEERMEIMRKGLTCDTFIMGTNAATQDGQLYNIDGNGNRTAALIFGPKQVIVIVGMNKVEPTLEAAISRARSTAATINAQRFGIPTPCNANGMCADCLSPKSICNQMVRTRRNSGPQGRIKIILVGENLGY